MKLIHLSDIHVWRWEFNPLLLLGKRSVGMFALVKGRARRFRLERLADVVAKVRSLNSDHLLITGDLTTTALSGEFADARAALAPLLIDPDRVTILPGNHDRYTRTSVRKRRFESSFGEFAPATSYPWLRWIDRETAILGLDPTRHHWSARGLLPSTQLARAKTLWNDLAERPRRLVVACHYPLAAPGPFREELARKRLENAAEIASWLATFGPHLLCCGHVHAAWAFEPSSIPGQLCLNSGAPLLRDPTGHRPPGFLEIDLDRTGVEVTHHFWDGDEWLAARLFSADRFFREARSAV